MHINIFLKKGKKKEKIKNSFLKLQKPFQSSFLIAESRGESTRNPHQNLSGGEVEKSLLESMDVYEGVGVCGEVYLVGVEIYMMKYVVGVSWNLFGKMSYI